MIKALLPNVRLPFGPHTAPLLGSFLSVAATFFFAGPAQGAEKKPKLKSVDDIAGCFEQWSTDECVTAVDAFVKQKPGQAFDAGRAITMGTSHWVAVPFFEKALGANPKPETCGDERLKLAVISALGLPNEGNRNKTVSSARKIVTGPCWSQLGKAVTEATEKEGGYLVDNVCPILADKKQDTAACKPKAAAPAEKPETWEGLDPKTIDVEGPAKVFTGAEGRRLTMAKVKGSPYYLVKFDGFRGAWNGRVLLHREREAASGRDYWTSLKGAEHVSVVARGTGGSLHYEAYPQGDKGPIDIYYDGDASTKEDPRTILSQFAKQ